jgi:hypothetical protein
MEENKTEPIEAPKDKKAKKGNMATLLLGLLAVVLLAASGYLWMQLQSAKDDNAALQKDKQTLQGKLDALGAADDTQAASPSPSPQACNDIPSTSMKDNIKAALDTENTAVFATYTANPVMFVLAASEEGGNKTPDQAAVSMEYTHTATGPWDFNLPAATLAAYDGGFYTDYFDANTYVGKAASGMVAAFDFDCSGKIKQIFVAADAGLL